MREEELLPCPFCGSKDLKVYPMYDEETGKDIHAYYVHCRDCFAQGRATYPIGWCECETEARHAWNDRIKTDNPIQYQQMKRIEADIYSWCQSLDILKKLIEEKTPADEYIGLIKLLSNDIGRVSDELFEKLGGVS